MLDEAVRSRLREIAARAVHAAARGAEPSADRSDDLDLPGLEEPGGAFVTLKRSGRLRGCIGTIEARAPVRVTVHEMAIAAARRDSRFAPVGPDEVEDLTIEISVLSPLERIHDPEEIEVGRHGLYVVKGAWTGLLLPQVPGEYGWDREEFLERTCVKAGLPSSAWQEEGTEIYRFEAEVF